MILLDTDVLVDVALNRSPHAEPAAALLTFLETSPPMSFVAWHSISNFYYLVRPIQGGDHAREFLKDLTRFVRVATTDTDAFRFGASLGLSDFEDALQVAAAHACGVELIVTRNLKDYRRSPIPAVSPAKALKLLT